MGKIREVKKALRHQEWAEQMQECQSSGMYVKEWCRQKGINPNTYYQRLRVVREEMLEHTEIEEQKIVPVCVSEAITGNTLTEVTDKRRNDAPVLISERIVLRKDGMEVEIPQNTSEETILMLMRGLKQC